MQQHNRSLTGRIAFVRVVQATALNAHLRHETSPHLPRYQAIRRYTMPNNSAAVSPKMRRASPSGNADRRTTYVGWKSPTGSGSADPRTMRSTEGLSANNFKAAKAITMLSKNNCENPAVGSAGF